MHTVALLAAGALTAAAGTNAGVNVTVTLALLQPSSGADSVAPVTLTPRMTGMRASCHSQSRHGRQDGFQQDSPTHPRCFRMEAKHHQGNPHP